MTSGTLTINTAIPTISISGGPFNYDGNAHGLTATAIGSNQAQLAGTITLTYDGSTTAPTNAGNYAIVANFISSDLNYRNSSIAGSMTIAKAAPTADIGWLYYPGGGPWPTITFDGRAHEATANVYGVNSQEVAGSYSFNYSPVATPTNAGDYVVSTVFSSSDSNYAGTTFTATLTIEAYSTNKTGIATENSLALPTYPHQSLLPIRLVEVAVRRTWLHSERQTW